MEVWLTSLKYALEKAIKKDPAKFSLNSSKNNKLFCDQSFVYLHACRNSPSRFPSSNNLII